MKTENLKKPLAFLMAVLMSVSCFGQSMGVAAADTGTEPDEGTDSYEESLVGDERAIEELPLSIGEIESIQSNTATFTIKLDADQDREHYYKQATIRELFEADKSALMPLPTVWFDTSRVITGLKTDAYGRFTLENGKHEYSSAPKFALGTVNVRLDSTFVTVLDDDYREIVTHKRLYGDERQSSIEWIPYLDYVSRHPRSVKNTGINAMMPDAMQS